MRKMILDRGKMRRNIALDIFRIIAATLIVLHHYQQGTGIVLKYINFYGGKFNFGYIVGLFFLISGLLLDNWYSIILCY